MLVHQFVAVESVWIAPSHTRVGQFLCFNISKIEKCGLDGRAFFVLKAFLFWNLMTEFVRCMMDVMSSRSTWQIRKSKTTVLAIGVSHFVAPSFIFSTVYMVFKSAELSRKSDSFEFRRKKSIPHDLLIKFWAKLKTISAKKSLLVCKYRDAYEIHSKKKYTVKNKKFTRNATEIQFSLRYIEIIDEKIPDALYWWAIEPWKSISKLSLISFSRTLSK